MKSHEASNWYEYNSVTQHNKYTEKLRVKDIKFSVNDANINLRQEP